jgi:hypothetical protein
MAAQKWAKEGKVLGELILDRGYRHNEFADMMNVSTDVMSNLVRGITQLRGSRRKKAAALLGMDELELKQHLDGGGGPIAITLPTASLSRSSGVQDDQTTVNIAGKVHVVRKGQRLVPIYGALPAGSPAASYSNAISAEILPDWGTEHERWGRVITGDSMTPEFTEGDVAIFEDRVPADYHGVHARNENEDVFKILRKSPMTGAELWPCNREDHEPFSAKDWTILGVCIMRIRYGEGGVKDTREYPYGFFWRFR